MNVIFEGIICSGKSTSADRLVSAMQHRAQKNGLLHLPEELTTLPIGKLEEASGVVLQALRQQRLHQVDVLDIPGMEPVAALGFRLAERYLSAMFPEATLDYLQPHFQRAREVLKRSTQGGYRWWANKVRMLPRGLDLIPAQINREVQDAVYRALFQGSAIPRAHQIAVMVRGGGSPSFARNPTIR